MRAGQKNKRKKRAVLSKKPKAPKRKIVKREDEFKNSVWYEWAARSISAAPKGGEHS
jgi:hypothetical protein